MSETKRLLKNTGIIALGGISTKLLSFLLLPLYTALLTPEDYGVIDYVTVLSIFLIPFVSLVMDETVFRFLVECKTPEDVQRRFSQAFCVVLCGIGVFLPACGLAVGLTRYTYGWYLIPYVILSVISGMFSAYYRGTGRMKQYAAYNFALSALTILFNLLLVAVFRMGLTGMLLGSLGAVVGLVAYCLIFVKLYRLVSFHGIRKTEMREMVRYALPLIPNRISWNAVSLVNRLLIINTLSEAANGIYAIGLKFPTLVNTAYGFFYQSWMESAARVRESDKEGLEAYYNQVFSDVKRVMLSAVLCVIAFLPLIFRFFVNEQFADAMPLVPIALLAVLFDSYSSFLGGIFTASKNTRIMGRTTLIAALVSCLFCAAAISRIGLYAAVSATLAAYLISFIIRRKKVMRHCALKTEPRWNLVAVLCAAGTLALFYSGNGILRLCVYPLALGFSLWSCKGLLQRFIVSRRESHAA